VSAPLDFDARLRLAVFDRVTQLRRASGGLVSALDLSAGIEFEGQHIPIWNQQRGIYRPAVLGSSGSALTIVTTPPKPGKAPPYDDHLGEDDDWIAYRYRGTDPSTFDNVALRRAGELQRPLLYLVGIRPGLYDPLFPAYIVADDPSTLTAHVSIGAPTTVHEPLAATEATFAIERRYHTIAVKQRLHQRKFRELVLAAYKERCAMCSLGHSSLLDAAHILEDKDERGRPEIPNGVARCEHPRDFARLPRAREGGSAGGARWADAPIWSAGAAASADSTSAHRRAKTATRLPRGSLRPFSSGMSD
jgi:putative restriction endonuclease